MEVISGIHQLKLPTPTAPLDHINVYLVRGDNECLLIDTGWDTPEAFAALQEQLEEIGIKFNDITQILITHIHVDHFGLAGKLRRLSGADVAMHRKDAELVDARYINMDGLLEQVWHWLESSGVPRDELPQFQEASMWMSKFVRPELPEKLLDDGDTISAGPFNLKVVWTPGHSPGHICLYEPERKILFSGDHILPLITPHIGIHPQSGANPLAAYLKSLTKVQGLDIDLALPGHGPVIREVQQRIEELLHHHEERAEAIAEVITGRCETAYHIASQITWMESQGGVAGRDLDSFNRRLALMETMSHLELLEGEGRVEKVLRDGTVFYSALKS